MDRNYYDSAFEELIKEKADQYKMYPSDKVWKGIDSSLRSRRKWYWSGFVILLSGISYLAITDLMSPPSQKIVAKTHQPAATKVSVTTDQLVPFSSEITTENTNAEPESVNDAVISDISIEDSGAITASLEIPLKFLDVTALTGTRNTKQSIIIADLEPLGKDEQYNIELSWPVMEPNWKAPAGRGLDAAEEKESTPPVNLNTTNKEPRINWLQEHAALQNPPVKIKRISWQLAFSPTVNYRKLTGSRNAKLNSSAMNIPLAFRIDGTLDNLVNHKPALGFELGTHGLLKLNNRLTVKGGIQFNYSKYDIRAFRSPSELATISLNPSASGNISSLTSISNIRNFGGTSAEDLKNQYFQLSVPVGLEFRILGNDRLQLNIAGTIQPTYLLNQNTYLITTDYKNYTKAPSLVRRWNMNAGAEAFISYTRGGVKWQMGPQFRYQLLSSYQNEYPIKEYLMEYGIKIGITKTIR